MNTLAALLDSGRYRAEVERLGPALARHELWQEANRRALRIADRLIPLRDHGRGFRFHHGPEIFEAVMRKDALEKRKRLALLEYARDQILAKLERRLGMAQVIQEMP